MFWAEISWLPASPWFILATPKLSIRVFTQPNNHLVEL